MSKDRLPPLTGPELELMKAFWDAGELGAREVHDTAGARLGWAYSTTRTTLERMVRKGLVSKRDLHGLYVYGAAISRVQGIAGLVREFAARVLEGDAAPVVSLFSEQGRLDDAEIAELHRILDAADRAADR